MLLLTSPIYGPAKSPTFISKERGDEYLADELKAVIGTGQIFVSFVPFFEEKEVSHMAII